VTTTFLPEVPLTRLVPHGANPRHQLRDLDDLAASIKAKGVLEPLVVAPLNGTQYRIIAGHRRHAAAKQAGLTTVSAVLREDLDTPAKQLEAMVIENGQRVDLSPIEEAEAYQALLDFPTYTVAKVAKATGKSTKTIKGRLALAKLPDKTRDRIHDGQITLQEANTLTAFVGTKDYASIVKTVGTPQFPYAVQRARDNARAREQLAVVVAHADATDDWTITDDWNACGRAVLQDWNAPKSIAALEKALDSLTGPHVVRKLGDHNWSVCEPRTADDRPPLYGNSPEAIAAREQREARASELETARKVRSDWLCDRLDKLVLSDTERLGILRLIVLDHVQNGHDDDAELTLIGAPATPDGKKYWDQDVIDALKAWATQLTEPQAWKALVVLSFTLTLDSGNAWEGAHRESIEIAQLLGYQPSDVELELLAEQ
jgi:ParB family chromosome partitioning protein